MNSSTEGRGPGCVADEVIEEYAVERCRRRHGGGQTPDKESAALEEHVQMCPACRPRMTRAEQEAAFMGDLLTRVPDESPSACPSIEDLARFVDGATDAADREACVAHLASCQACRGSLVRLYREVQAVTADESPESETPGVRVAFDDIKVRVAERDAIGNAASDESIGDSDERTEQACTDEETGLDIEGRKRRYSSQSD